MYILKKIIFLWIWTYYFAVFHWLIRSSNLSHRDRERVWLVVIDFDHAMSRFNETKEAKKLTDIIKYSHVHKKRRNFLLLNRQARFKDIISMHAAFPVISLIQNIISASLLSKNSGNESFSGINFWDFNYSNIREMILKDIISL